MSDSDSFIGELLNTCLERTESEGPEALDAMCLEHPAHARALRDGFEKLAALGLAPCPTQTTPADFPESLGDFQLIRKIGGGGMGVVYLARQESLSRRVALKVIRPDRVYYPQEVARFRREVEAIARLRHPGIVSVIAVGQDRQIPYFAMEWLEGATLFELLRCFEGRRVTELEGADLWRAVTRLADEAAQFSGEQPESTPITQLPDLFQGSWCDVSLRIARQLADVLQHAHGQGIVHRDIKPSNIWITPSGRVVLIDFGLARSADASRLTNTGARMGSLLYMSPEQISGMDVDERTDIYSLGVTLYETLACRSPFESESSEIAARRIIDGDAPKLRTWNPSITRDAQTVCMKAMTRDAGGRYAGAASLSRDLENLLGRRPIVARPPGWIVRTRRWTQRHPARTVGLLLLASLVFFATFTAVRERRALRRVQLLADAHWIEQLTSQARSFWPMSPAKIEPIDSWLDEVAQVRERHTIHRRELLALRRIALPYTEQDAARDRAPIEATIAGLRDELELVLALVDAAENPAEAMEFNRVEIADLQSLIADLRSKDTRRTWRFAERSAEWRHERLTRLVETEYRDLLELEANVRRHRADTAAVHQESLVECRDDWQRAITDIARLEVYGGLRIEPQMSLRPLRRNPQSGLWEFLHVLSGDEPRLAPSEADPGRLAVDASSGIVLVLLPGGEARTGLRDHEADSEVSARPDPSTERPLHTVHLAPFFLSKYEMTVAQYQRLQGTLATGQEPSAHPFTEDRNEFRSVLERTWLDFPTEAQWEYACRAGTDTAFYTGNFISSLEGHANVADRAQIGSHRLAAPLQYTDRFDDGFEFDAPVGSFLPNPFGLYDMHGNVSEWMADIHINRAYSTMKARPGDGLRFFARDWLPGLRYATRGGSYTSVPANVRSAKRYGVMAEVRWRRPGVRPARAIID